MDFRFSQMIIVGILATCWGISPVRGEYYYYEDEQGTIRFSDEPPQVSKFSIGRGYFDEFAARTQKYSRTALRKLIVRYSKKYHIDPALVEAIVKVESSYDTEAVSHKGAQGLMQLMPTTAKSLGVSNSHDPKQNLAGGIQYLRKLLDRYDGNVELALAAYNAGEGAVQKYNGVPPYPETVDYVAKVRKYYLHLADFSSSDEHGKNNSSRTVFNP